MNHNARMGRKPLGKVAYQFTSPPDLMKRFDRLAASLGTTRSDLLVSLMRDRLAREAAGKGK
jgi:hypothetical protein